MGFIAGFINGETLEEAKSHFTTFDVALVTETPFTAIAIGFVK